MADIIKYIEEWNDSKEWIDNYIKDFKDLDTIANAQYPRTSGKNPNIGDTTIAGIIREIMRKSVKKMPSTTVAINGSKGTVEALVCRFLVEDVVLNPNTFGKGFVNILHLGGRGSLSRGFNVFQVSSAKMYGQFGVIPKLIHFNDFAIEKGVQEGGHSSFFDIRTKFTPSKLQKIYDRESRKPKGTSTWNIEALKALLAQGPNSNGSADYAQYVTPMEISKIDKAVDTYDIITRYSNDLNEDIITFTPGINQELRTVPNRSKFGFPRVLMLVIDPAELSPFGDSRVRLASPNQNFLMALRQNVATTWMYNSRPTMVKMGVFSGATELKNGGVITSTDPNSKIELLTLDTATSQQYPTISAEVTKQIQNMMGMNAAQSLGAIGESKTGVGAQAQKSSIDDATQQVTSIIEEFLRQYVTSGLDLYLSEQDGDGVVYVDDRTREDILRVNPNAFDNLENPNALAINWNDLYDYIKKIDITIDTTISKEEFTNEKRADLQDALTVMSQTANPNDPASQSRIKQVEDKFLDETVPELAQAMKTPEVAQPDLTQMMQPVQ